MPHTRLAQAVLLIITLSWGSVPVYAAGSSGDGPLDIESAPPKEGLPQDGEQKTDPVSVVTGSVHKETVDLYLPDRIPLQLDRTYRSADVYEHLGYNWRFNYHSRLIERPEANAIWEVGEDNYLWKHVDNLDGTYVPPKGRRERILRLPDGAYIVRGPHGRQRRYAPADPKGIARLVSISDTYGNTLTLTYHDDGQRLRRVTSPSGKWMDFEYDDHSKVTRVTDSAGRAVTYEYDRFGRLITVVKPGGRTTRYEYGSGPQTRLIVAEIGPTGNTWRHVYDEKGRAITVIAPDWSTVSFDYDPANKRTTLRWENGAREVYHYDDDANTVKVVDPAGDARQMSYQEDRVVTRTDPMGAMTEYGYDQEGRLSLVRDAMGGENRYEYGRHDRLISYTNPTGAAWKYQYDDKGQLVSSTGPDGGTYSYTYDSHGGLASRVEPDEKSESWSRSVDGLVKTYADAAGHKWEYVYDDRGYPVSVTDPTGAVTSYEYDDAGDQISVTDALGRRTSFEYDKVGLMTAMINAAGGRVQFKYDSMKRLVTQTHPDGSIERYVYDAASNPIEKHLPDGTQVLYSYDPLNRLIRRESGDIVHEYVYDKAGRPIVCRDEQGEHRYEYDKAGRTLSVAGPGDKVIRYAYDAAGRRTRIVYPDGSTLRYEYGSTGRLTKIIGEDDDILAQYDYDALGRRISLKYANGVETRYQYSAAGDTVKITHRLPSGDIALSYDHDAIGRRVKSVAGSLSTQYGYDAAGQLVSAARPDGSQALYEYDEVGRVSARQAADVGIVYGPDDRIIRRGEVEYTYNPLGRMSGSTSGDQKVFYRYDALGRRIAKEIQSSDERQQISYTYDGLNILQMDETDGQRTVFYHPPWLDEPIAMLSGGERYFYLYDALGSVIALTDASGGLVESYVYEPFGLLRILNAGGTAADRSSVGNIFYFTGRELDEETGLYHYRFRQYDPKLARFTSPDPLGYMDSVNRHAYAANDPINRMDPLGLYVYTGGPGVGPAGPDMGAPSLPPAGPDMGGVQGPPPSGPFDGGAPWYGPGYHTDGPGIQFPGWDPGKPPVPEWGWTGPDPQGGAKGGYKEPGGRRSWHPDLDNDDDGPHWDYNDKFGRGWRVYPDGRVEAKDKQGGKPDQPRPKEKC